MLTTPAKPALLSATEQEALAAKHRTLEVSIAAFRPGDAIDSLAQALRYFEDVTRETRQQLVAIDFLKSREELAAGEWVCQRYQHLLAMTQAVVARGFAAGFDGKASPAQGSALGMLLSGHLVKWRKYAGGRADPAAREWRFHLFGAALTNAIEGVVISARIEERTHEATAEALFLRAMLLDRFCGGNLSPRRFEILDNWLVAWMGALWLSREAGNAEHLLGVNLVDVTRGFVPHVPGDAAQLFLSLAPLKRQLDRTIDAFHQGTIFPGWGVAMTMRMEDHVAVIEFLERELLLIEQFRARAAAQVRARSKRISINVNTIVAVYFGFGEISRDAFRPDRVSTMIGGGGDLGIRNAIRLVDLSEGGLGLEMVDEDARRVHVNDLVAVRLEKGKPCLIGVVARKSTLQMPTGTLVGIKIISRSPLRLTMDRVNEANQWQACEGMLIQGLDAEGHGDSVIFGESDYVANSLVAATLGGRVHEFYARRVREQGRGWRMAAIDAVDRTA